MGNLFYVILICLVVAIVAIVLTVKVFIPADPVATGDKLHVYIGRRYNRTATVDGMDTGDGVIFIYGDFPLPCTYHGRFHASGYMSDGNKLIFVKNKRLLIPVLLAEFIRF